MKKGERNQKSEYTAFKKLFFFYEKTGTFGQKYN